MLSLTVNSERGWSSITRLAPTARLALNDATVGTAAAAAEAMLMLRVACWRCRSAAVVDAAAAAVQAAAKLNQTAQVLAVAIQSRSGHRSRAKRS